MKRGILKNEFNEKYSKTAEFVAWLTDCVYYKDDDVLKITSLKDLSDLVAEKYKANEYVEADRLLRFARKTIGVAVEDELSQVSSKSIRVSTPSLLQIMMMTRKLGCSRSDIIRKKVGPRMKKILNELSEQSKKQNKKLSLLQDILDRWLKKKTQAPRRKSPVHLDDPFGREFQYLSRVPLDETSEKIINKWAESYFIIQCDYLGIDRDFSDKIWDQTCIWWEEDPFISFESGENINVLKINSGLLHREFKKSSTIQISTDEKDINAFSKFFTYFEALLHLEDLSKYNRFKIGDMETPAFDNEVDAKNFFKLGNRRPVFEMDWFYPYFHMSRQVKIKENNGEREILFNGIVLTRKYEKELIKLFWEDLMNPFYFDMKGEKRIDIEKLEVELRKKSIQSLSKRDLETSTEASSELAFIESSKDFATWIANKLIEIVEKTHVITFTIPTPLLRLWEAVGEQIDIESIFFEEV